MKTILTGALLMSFLCSAVYATADTWKSKVYDDKKTKVEWRISENNKGFPVVEYKVTTTTREVTMKNLVSVLENISNHKKIMDCAASKPLEETSNNKWKIYYNFDAPWPLKDSEVAVTMTHTDNAQNNTTEFKIQADAEIFLPKNTNARRMNVYDLNYILKKAENDSIEISIISKSVPTVKAPRWMMEAMFPSMGVDLMNRLIKLARLNN